jgi:hypothetical protein
MFKILKRLLLLPILLVVALVAFALTIDGIAKRAIESGGKGALGTDTTVDDADVGLFTGNIAAEGFKVSNPPGTAEGHILTVTKTTAKVDPKRLLGGTIRIPELSLAGVNLTLERGIAESNYGPVLDHMAKSKSGSEGEGRRLILEVVRIEDVTVSVKLRAAGRDVIVKELKIPKIELTNVGAEGNKGVVMAELTAEVVKALFSAAAEKGGGILPPDVLGDLGTRFRDAIKGASGGLRIFDSISKDGKSVDKVVDGLKSILKSGEKK